MKKPLKIIVISVASLALAGGVGAGIAAADPSSSPSPSATPSTSASPTPGTKADKKAERKAARKAGQQGVGGARVIRRALHGEVTLAGKKHQVVIFQRGQVASVNGSSITVRSNDAFTGTYAVATTTRVRVKQEPAKIGDVEPGDRVLVVAAKGGDVPTARLVVQRGA